MSNKNTHVGVSGILYENGQILLGKRAADDDALPGLWNTPGGGLNFREHIADGLAREFMEETGLLIRDDYLRGTDWQYIGEGLYAPDRHTIMIFRPITRLSGNAAQALDGLSEVKWFTWQEIREASAAEILTPLTGDALAAFYDWRQNLCQ